MAYENGVELNIVFEADSISLQTYLVSESRMYTMLGPQALKKPANTPQFKPQKLLTHHSSAIFLYLFLSTAI